MAFLFQFNKYCQKKKIEVSMTVSKVTGKIADAMNSSLKSLTAGC